MDLVIKMKTLCFTGRRPQKLPWGYNEEDERCVNLKKKIEEKIDVAIKDGFTHFISGMALGVDMWAAEIVIRKKAAGEKITLEAAIPHKQQAEKWAVAHKKRYNRILQECDKITFVSENYSPYCMMKRNCYMVDNSDMIIAVLDDFTGGSGKTALYARSKNVPVIVISI